MFADVALIFFFTFSASVTHARVLKYRYPYRRPSTARSDHCFGVAVNVLLDTEKSTGESGWIGSKHDWSQWFDRKIYCILRFGDK